METIIRPDDVWNELKEQIGRLISGFGDSVSVTKSLETLTHKELQAARHKYGEVINEIALELINQPNASWRKAACDLLPEIYRVLLLDRMNAAFFAAKKTLPPYGGGIRTTTGVSAAEVATGIILQKTYRHVA